MEGLEIDCGQVRQKLVNFIKDEVRKAGFKKAIIGISGGIDSAVAAYLCSSALGAKNVYGILMPYRTTGSECVKDAEMIAKETGINRDFVDISPMIDSYFNDTSCGDKLRRGNKMARERMSILYDLSVRHNALVIGTSNKSEILLGYGTIYGDTACAIMPLGDLYKTQVRKLAAFLGVPEPILKKVPSADLWPGQTDEGEMGFTYKEADEILCLMVDCGKSEQEIVASGFDGDLLKRVSGLVKKMEFKRRPPVVASMCS